MNKINYQKKLENIIERMEYLITFVISVVARVAGNYISKWLDRLKSDK